MVDEGQTVTEPFALDPVPSHTVSGTITDGSGAGWPIYAKITVKGASAATYSDPYTGHYSLSLPEGATYTVHAESQYPGYLPIDQDVTVGGSNQTVDLQAMVDPSTCAARATPTSTTGPRRPSPAGPAPRPRTAGPSPTASATARRGASTTRATVRHPGLRR